MRRGSRRRVSRRALVGAAAALAVVAAPAWAAKDDLVMVSRTSSGVGADDDSLVADISGDGRYVVFMSDADNLSVEDDDSVRNIFVRDLVAGTTTLVNRATGPAGAAGNGEALNPTISADGRYVAFQSTATNLSPDDNPVPSDVFVRDLVAGTTTLVSRDSGVNGPAGDSSSFSPDISADGRHVAFATAADNFSAEDDDSVQNVYVRDLDAATTTWVSRGNGPGIAADDHSRTPAISADGRHVAFNSSADNLSSEDDDSVQDIFVRDLVAGTTTLASRASGAAGVASDADAFEPAISPDGRLVAFRSAALTLSDADDDAVDDVFVRDLVAGTTSLVSRGGGAGPGGDGQSTAPAFSGDGRWLAFSSSATNLSGEDGAFADIFTRDLQTEALILVSRGAGPAGGPANGVSSRPAVSEDGRYVAFDTTAENLAPVGGVTFNVFRRDVLGPTAPATTAANRCATVATPPPGSGPRGRIALSRAQLRINQRIGQAAIRRLAAIDAWLEAGIRERDICGGSIGPADLAPGIVAEPAASSLAPLGTADPRPITPATKAVDGRTRFRLTPGQLLINQRIYQAAVRRANALQARLASGLTGGDVADGAIGQGRLHDRLHVVLAPATTPVPKSTTAVAPAGGGRPGAVTLSARQLQINQRVAQAGVRRANALVADLSAGLTGADFRDGTLGSADLAAGVVQP